MAFDLILGNTHRDWSCGSQTPSGGASPARPLDGASLPPQKLGEVVRSEIQKNYDTIVRLVTTKRMPDAERRSFGGFFRKWILFALPKDGKFRSDDVVSLMNFRAANGIFTSRLGILTDLAKTPLARTPLARTPIMDPGTPTPAGTPAPDPQRPWGLLSVLGFALGIFGLGFVSGRGKLNT